MANWMCSGFIVTGDPAEVGRFKSLMFRRQTDVELAEDLDPLGKGLKFDFNGIIPMPAEEALSNYEGWALRNWGSNLNAEMLCVSSEKEGEMRFMFDTPWNFPTPVFEALADEFPGLVFRGTAYEENGDYELKGQFNGADDWGPGKTDWLIIKLSGGDDDDDDDDDDDLEDTPGTPVDRPGGS